MDPEAVYAKTDKGREEISQRAYGLPQRLRTLLVMIDGQTRAADHREKCKGLGDVSAMLAMLARQGFIEEIRGRQDTVAPTSAQVPAERSLEAVTRFAVDRVLSLLGPDGDMLTARLEKAGDRAALIAELERCRTVLQTVAGAQAAERFWAGVAERLPN